MRYIPELDGLRAIAVSLVITAHLKVAGFAELNGPLGVTIFFVLSGYLITSIILTEEIKAGSVSFSAFYVRRSFRIFPLYYFVLSLYCVLIFLTNVSPEKQIAMKAVLPYDLFYLQEIPYMRAHHGDVLPFGQSWSLGIEEKFYLAWPLICFLLLKYSKKLRIPVALILVIVCAFNRYTRPYIPILFGCILALGLQFSWFSRVVERSTVFGTWLLLGLLLLLHFALPPSRTSMLSESLYAAVFAIFLALLLAGRSPLNRILALPPLVFLGKLSYGIYLVHILCINVVREKLHCYNASSLFSISLVLSLVVAAVLHYSLERPFIAFGRNLSDRLRTGQLQEPLAASD